MIGVDPHRDSHALAVVHVISAAIVFGATVTANGEGYAGVVADIDTEDTLELATGEDEQPVEALATDAADRALDVRVRIRCPERRVRMTLIRSPWKQQQRRG